MILVMRHTEPAKHALVLFDNEGLRSYRTVYNPLRSYIWDLNTIYGSSADTASEEKHELADLQGNLTLDSMVSLTLDNTKLLDNYRSANQKQNSKQKNQAFIAKLEQGGKSGMRGGRSGQNGQAA